MRTRNKPKHRVRVLIFWKWGYKCVYCGLTATTLDHIYPRALGGTNDKDNLVPACRWCNQSKNVNTYSPGYLDHIINLPIIRKTFKSFTSTSR